MPADRAISLVDRNNIMNMMNCFVMGCLRMKSYFSLTSPNRYLDPNPTNTDESPKMILDEFSASMQSLLFLVIPNILFAHSFAAQTRILA